MHRMWEIVHGRMCKGEESENMNLNKLLDNIMEQIKEAQLKLGFVREVIRLYFPVPSLCRLLQVKEMSGKELLAALIQEESFLQTPLGEITFTLCKEERIEVCIPPQGAVYVHEQIPDPPFLTYIIKLFQENHHLTIEEIGNAFSQFNKNYVCEAMQPGTDFDYVLYFPDGEPDAWYYCIHMEMGHTIYHRFTKEDYQLLVQN